MDTHPWSRVCEAACGRGLLLVRAIRETPRQLKALLLWIGLAVLLCTVVAVGAYAISVIEGIPAADMTRDPLQTFRARFYIGLISNLCILLWMGTATVSLCAGAALRVVPAERERSSFYLLAGAFTLLLTVDDFFLFHEKIWPFVTRLPEEVLIGGYALFVAWLVLRYLPVILSGPYVLLGIGLVFFGLSVLIDTFLPQVDPYVFIEDSFKLFGLAFWLLYFSLMAVGDLQRFLVAGQHADGPPQGGSAGRFALPTSGEGTKRTERT